MMNESSQLVQTKIVEKLMDDIQTRKNIFSKAFTTDSQRQLLTLCLRLEKLKCVAAQDNEARRDNLGQLHHESITFAKTVVKLDEASHFIDAVSKSLVLRFNQAQVKAALKIISDEVKSATEQNVAVNARLEFKQTTASRTPTGFKNRTIDLSAQKKKI